MKAIECLVETAIYSENLETAQAFYQGVLGLSLLGKEASRHIFFQVGDRHVLLVFTPDATLKGDRLPPHGTHGPGHFAFGIAAEDLDDWRDLLARHAVEIEREQTWPRGGRSLYFRDPAGNLVELITRGVWGLPSGW